MKFPFPEVVLMISSSLWIETEVGFEGELRMIVLELMEEKSSGEGCQPDSKVVFIGW